MEAIYHEGVMVVKSETGSAQKECKYYGIKRIM